MRGEVGRYLLQRSPQVYLRLLVVAQGGRERDRVEPAVQCDQLRECGAAELGIRPV